MGRAEQSYRTAELVRWAHEARASAALASMWMGDLKRADEVFAELIASGANTGGSQLRGFVRMQLGAVEEGIDELQGLIDRAVLLAAHASEVQYRLVLALGCTRVALYDRALGAALEAISLARTAAPTFLAAVLGIAAYAADRQGRPDEATPLAVEAWERTTHLRFDFDTCTPIAYLRALLREERVPEARAAARSVRAAFDGTLATFDEAARVNAAQTIVEHGVLTRLLDEVLSLRGTDGEA
jgi:hypothetical protein